MRFRTALLALLLVSGCSQPAKRQQYAADVTDVAIIKPAGDAAAVSAPAAEATAQPETAQLGRSAAPLAPTAPMLAYSYHYRIAAPPKAIRALAARHEAACVAAGPAICQVTASEITAEGEGEVRGTLTLRAGPAWLRKFRDGLTREARDAGGEVLSAAASSEDLTRQIVDTEAAMRAKTTLRDRLQGLLANRPGKLSELLELEQALAEVQQQIDAANSELAVMRTRIATSALTLNYASSGIAGRPGAWAPLGEAVGDAGGMLATSLGALVSLVVIAAPWGLALAGLWFLIRKRLPRRKPPA